MLIDSLRFGEVEIPDDKEVTMKRPILGFESLSRFCLVERVETLPFLWLHSMEDPAVAFIVVNPAVFFPDYRIEVNRKEVAELEIARLKSVETYVIVTILQEQGRISANLQGPVLINTENGYAKQLVLVNSEYRVQHDLMDAVECEEPSREAERHPVGV